MKRLCCDGAVVPVVERDGEPLSVGRKQRTAPTAIKRALLARDRSCTFPGCHHGRFLEAHHVHHWVDGGETSLSNLLLVCSTHHTLIDERGFSVVRRADGTRCFARPGARPVEAPSSAEDPAPVGSSSAEDEHHVRDVRGVYHIGRSCHLVKPCSVHNAALNPYRSSGRICAMRCGSARQASETST